MTEKERVTVDFDCECYYLDGEYWGSWDNYGEEMADKINDLLNETDKSIKILTNHNKEYLHSINILEDKLKKLKELEKENVQLKQQLYSIYKSYIDYYGMNIRNAEWYGFKGDD